VRTCQLLVILVASSFALACGGDDDGGPVVDAGDEAGEPPVISQVTWTFEDPCTPNEASGVVVEVTVTDADTPADDLTFAGSAGGCTGSVTTNPATITCPNVATYSGMITVTDPESNADSQAIALMPCTDDSAP
jgi:hypothetical protein